MATIAIFDLHPTGYNLFSDSEGYMNDLDENELFIINGGIISLFCNPINYIIITAYLEYRKKH